jgi:hypothetical protein
MEDVDLATLCPTPHLQTKPLLKPTAYTENDVTDYPAMALIA